LMTAKQVTDNRICKRFLLPHYMGGERRRRERERRAFDNTHRHTHDAYWLLPKEINKA